VKISTFQHIYNFRTRIQFATIVADPDPGAGAFLTPRSGMGKNQDPDPDENPGSYLETIARVTNT
jgi:hypothetical protein